jgi:threonylcarbamoyladenosine tRNA methylthiotransferase MtaB
MAKKSSGSNNPKYGSIPQLPFYQRISYEAIALNIIQAHFFSPMELALIEESFYYLPLHAMNPNPTVAFYTLGCKLNFSESSAIAREFNANGYARVEIEDAPDVVVINTCSVTADADAKCRNIVRRALRFNPAARVAVIGCYAQLKPTEIAAIPGVEIVLGANEKFHLLQHLSANEKDRAKGRLLVNEIKETKEFVPGWSAGDRTRTFLKVQDGCNYFCSFCTIPLARGRSRSANIASTLESARQAIAEGAREIVLTGVNIGDFGTAHGESFFGLIQELDKLSGVERFRISSIEPNLLNEDIIRFVASSEKFMPHFHIPLQSGSNRILRAMRRRYLRELYSDRVHQIKACMPDACIGADVISGFPGENEEDFRESMEFIASLPVSYLHAFTYSERDNTTALRLEEIVPQEIRHERTRMLRTLSEKKKREFYQAHIGKCRKALMESEEDNGTMFGYTDNYLRIALPFNSRLVNQVSEVKCSTLHEDGYFLAELVQ